MQSTIVDDDSQSINSPGYERKVYRNPDMCEQINDQLLNEYKKKEKLPVLIVPKVKRNRGK